MRSLETIDNGTVWVNPAHVTMIFDRRGPEGVKIINESVIQISNGTTFPVKGTAAKIVSLLVD